MTIGDVKVKVLAWLDEIDSANLLANINDYINKLYPIIDSVQKDLAFLVCPIKKTATVTAENGELILPADLYEITMIFNAETGKNLPVQYKTTRIITGVPDGEYTVRYNATPQEVTKDTPDSYKLEIDEEGCEALIYGVCALICINDEPDLYAIYKNNYNTACQNIIQRRATHTFVTVSGGIDL